MTITKHGRPVARLVPANPRDPAKVKAAFEWLKKTRQDRSLGGLTIKDLINEGRKY